MTTQEAPTSWYFAIGSMLNPVSFAARGLTAADSKPAELLDHRITFRGRMGMAGVEPATGASVDRESEPTLLLPTR